MRPLTIFRLPKRFQLLKTFAITFLFISGIVRIVLYFLSFEYFTFHPVHLFQIFGIGFFFDIGALSYFLALYACYLLLVPKKYIGSKIDRIITKFTYGFLLFLLLFSFLAEIPFWQEYQRRYNFIAVDYLLYTYEVLENIHQSFPLPALLILIATLLSHRVHSLLPNDNSHIAPLFKIQMDFVSSTCSNFNRPVDIGHCSTCMCTIFKQKSSRTSTKTNWQNRACIHFFRHTKAMNWTSMNFIKQHLKNDHFTIARQHLKARNERYSRRFK